MTTYTSALNILEKTVCVLFKPQIRIINNINNNNIDIITVSSGYLAQQLLAGCALWRILDL